MQTIDKVSLSTSVFGADDSQERTLGHFLELAQQAGYTMVELSRRQKKAKLKLSANPVSKCGLSTVFTAALWSVRKLNCKNVWMPLAPVWKNWQNLHRQKLNTGYPFPMTKQ